LQNFTLKSREVGLQAYITNLGYHTVCGAVWSQVVMWYQ